jgi:hypothetical protein
MLDSIDFAIIEEWHAGDDALWMIDRRQFRGISLDEELFLAKPSRFRREWLIYVGQARPAATSVGDEEADKYAVPFLSILLLQMDMAGAE